MPATGFALGIDFGTSNTVAVARTPDGRVRTLLFDGSPLLPSAVYAEPDTLRVGRDAVLSARLDPARFEPQPKRRVDDGSVLLGDRAVPVVDLIAAVLGRVAEEWRRVVGAARPEVTMTCPASWAGPRRSVLAAAAEAAGLGTVSFVAEPVAAAAYFVHVLGHTMRTGSVLVVHDMGAGTFDVTAVARTARGFEVVAVAGRDDLGGADLDAALVDHLGTAAGIDHRWVTDPATVEERRWRRLLWDDVTAAKERLSRTVTAEILVPAAGVEAHLTRAELESVVGPALTESVTVTAKLAAAHGAGAAGPAGVFLVGGTSRIPLLSTLLFRALGRAPVAIEQPELVVAEGSVVPGVPKDPAPASAPAGALAGSLAGSLAGPPPAAPVPPRPDRWMRWLPAALMPLAAASATVLLAVGTLVVLGVAVGGLVGWSILTGQGFLPDWGWLPAAPWSSEPPTDA